VSAKVIPHAISLIASSLPDEHLSRQNQKRNKYRQLSLTL